VRVRGGGYVDLISMRCLQFSGVILLSCFSTWLGLR
jgi:hypothetical protein